jgi:hypothetical protein
VIFIAILFLFSIGAVRSCQHYSAVSLYEKSPNARTTYGSIARSWSIVSSATLDARKTPTAANRKVVLFSDAAFGLPKGDS